MKVAKQVEEVVQEDPTAFQYDEVYDDMKKGTKKAKVVEKKPKYVEAILAHAKEREKEREILMEKKIAREIEQEAEAYGDVEKFVTAGYKRKLEERQAWIEEEKAKEAEEDRVRNAPIDHQRRTTLFTGRNALPTEVTADDTSVRLTKGQPSPQQIPQNLPEKKKAAEASLLSAGASDAKDKEKDPSHVDHILAENNKDQECSPFSPGEAREQKIKEARARYLARKASRQSKP